MWNKGTIRETMRQYRSEMTSEQLVDWNESIHEQLYQLDEWKQARTIFTYISIEREVDTRSIIARAFREGKQVLVPRCIAQGWQMETVPIPSLEGLIPGSYAIPEPPADWPSSEDVIDLMLVPGLAFDRRGHRIGYGGSYYDHFLARYRSRIQKEIGLCFAFQLLDALPNERHDMPLNGILTEKAFIRLSGDTE